MLLKDITLLFIFRKRKNCLHNFVSDFGTEMKLGCVVSGASCYSEKYEILICPQCPVIFLEWVTRLQTPERVTQIALLWNVVQK